MGVDLTLLPLIGRDFWAAHDILRLERRSELWSDVEKLPQKPIPQALSCHKAVSPTTGDPCYGDTETTPYGTRITYTTAADLMTLKDNEAVQDNWQNRAIWAYLAQMPGDWPICLYWS